MRDIQFSELMFAARQLWDQYRIFKLSTNEKISNGNNVKFSESVKRWIPISSPDFN